MARDVLENPHLSEIQKLVIAAVGGSCVGGGNELVLVCDLVCDIKICEILTAGSDSWVNRYWWRRTDMPIAIGEKRAKELLLPAKFLTADQAYEWGLVNRVVEDSKLEDEAGKMALEVIEKSSPQAFRVIKLCIKLLG
ncbi:MAG: hypothetical protein DRN49_04685 [Thaumarchaeota archaeon]|nr:MAG: hypothetical protein DRN49_04685 [Nitrososphaerota archaeon]